MNTPESIITAARTWVGVPFRHQGRSRLGVDCAGLLVELLRSSGALPADYTEPRDYGRGPSRELGEILERYCTRTDSAAPATLILVRWPRESIASHVALCTGRNLIHCYERAGRVVEHRYGEPWLRMTDSIWKLPSVAYE
jgi:cell wall-associated NlpC family hydrolase